LEKGRIFLEKNVRNIQGRNITPPPLGAKGHFHLSVPIFLTIAFPFKIFELRLFSGSYFCTRPYVKPAGVAALAAYNAICRQAPQTTPPEAEVFRLEMAETTVRPL
jgi:hypothetical protein